MTEGQLAGLIGGIAGSLIGIAGGVVGTYVSIKNTRGPRERAFMIRVSAFAWATMVVFLTGLFLFPMLGRVLLWLIYGPLLAYGIRWGNFAQQRAAAEDLAGDRRSSF